MSNQYLADTTLREPWLGSVRVLWLLAAILASGLAIVSIPGYLTGFVFTSRVDAPIEFVSAMYSASVLASIASAIVSLVLAFLLFLRKSNERMALFVSFYLLGYGAIMAGPLEALERFFLNQTGSLSILAQTILLTAPTLALFYLFPNGRFVPRGTQWMLLLSLLLIPAVALGSSPEGWRTMSMPKTQVIAGGLGILILIGVYAQVYRYRFVSTPAERQQTKWVIFGLLLWVALMVMQGAPYVYLQQLSPDASQPWWGPLSGAIWWLSLAILPVSLTIAVFRHRLFDIDIIIRRTLVYGALTALLVLFYFGSVVLLQQIFRTITGASSELAIIVSTLAIAALFGPLRNRIQAIIDRRFYRKKYDAQQVLQEFAKAARDETDLEKLSTELLNVVNETMQPKSASVWINDPNVNKDIKLQ